MISSNGRFTALFGGVMVLGLTLAGCSANSTAASDTDETILMSVVPNGGATGVDPNGPIVVLFSHGMMTGMEEFADVHEGSVEGPLVEGSWSWNQDATQLTFTPTSPLKPQTQYVIHIGGGMMDWAGHSINYEEHGLGMGGQWMTQQMHQGGQHGHGGGQGGMGGGMGMGTGWTHPTNGSYGMVFVFTTA